MTSHLLLTVGHSTHTIEEFIQLLNDHGIEALCDVRSSPYSRFNPQFNREILDTSLSDVGIEYVYLGDNLGGRGIRESEFVEDRTSYQRIAESERFKEGMVRLQEGIIRYKVVIMCAEKDPIDCHRAILISRSLRKEPLELGHIRFNGSIESNADFEQRLLGEQRLPAGDLFSSKDDMIELAYEKQASAISYKRTKPDTDDAGDDLVVNP